MQTILAKRVVDCVGVEQVENLLLRREQQIDLNDKNLAQFHAGSHIILDFGKEMRGGVRLITHGSDLKPVRIRFGESVAECCAELGLGEAYSGKTVEREVSEIARRQNATNDHAMRDFSVLLPNWSDSTWGDTGFRFVRLDFSGECTIKSILCTNTMLSRRAKYIYSGDKELKKIFAAAKRTADLCAGGGYVWDGIKRDRMVWIGDLAPQVLALATLYGSTPEVERSIEFGRNYAPLPEWMNNMPAYSMWWIIMLQEYLERTGAEAFVEKQMDYLEGLVEQLSKNVDENGEMHYPSYFLDWPHVGSTEERDGTRAINILAAKAAIALLEHFGKTTQIAKSHLARLMKQDICPASRAVAALKFLAVGSLSEDERNILLADGIEGMSTFLSYYILKAMHAFSAQKAMKMLKEYYGGMLRLGATTFWEDFEPEQLKGSPIDKMPKKNKTDCHGDFGKHCYVGFRRSLCHGWSAGVIAFIKECGL